MASTPSPLDSVAPVVSPPLSEQLTVDSVGIQGNVSRATVSDGGGGDNPVTPSNTGGSDSLGSSMLNTAIDPPTITGDIGIPSASATTPVVLATPAKPVSSFSPSPSHG